MWTITASDDAKLTTLGTCCSDAAAASGHVAGSLAGALTMRAINVTMLTGAEHTGVPVPERSHDLIT
jgi:hypothetical protein